VATSAGHSLALDEKQLLAVLAAREPSLARQAWPGELARTAA